MNATTPSMRTPLAGAPALRHLLRLQLRPQSDLHPSWFPPTWPARRRRCAAFGPAGQTLLARWLRDDLPAWDYRIDTPRKRLLLMDGASLRRLAMWCGLALHARLMAERGPLAAQLRRQARRLDDEAVGFVLHRMPVPTAFRVDPALLAERPTAVGRVMVDRGYRLLQAAMASEGAAPLGHAQRRLPRRAAALRPLSLQPHQLGQLDELMRMCIVPEKLPQWDWLT